MAVASRRPPPVLSMALPLDDDSNSAGTTNNAGIDVRKDISSPRLCGGRAPFPPTASSLVVTLARGAEEKFSNDDNKKLPTPPHEGARIRSPPPLDWVGWRGGSGESFFPFDRGGREEGGGAAIDRGGRCRCRPLSCCCRSRLSVDNTSCRRNVHK